jgi:hypothetical protein
MNEENRERRFHTAFLALALFTAAYMLAAVAGAIATGNTEFVFYILVMLVIISGVLVVRTRLTLSLPLLWALSIWGFLHMAGGLVPVPNTWPIDGDIRVLYSWWIIPGTEGTTDGDGDGGILKYDQLTHTYGFGVATWLSWQTIAGVVRRQFPERRLRPTLGPVFIAALCGVGLGALNEVVEFIATLFAETNVGGYYNTGMDLIYNTIGAAIAAFAIALTDRLSPSADRPSRA